MSSDRGTCSGICVSLTGLLGNLGSAGQGQ